MNKNEHTKVPQCRASNIEGDLGTMTDIIIKLKCIIIKSINSSKEILYILIIQSDQGITIIMAITNAHLEPREKVMATEAETKDLTEEKDLTEQKPHIVMIDPIEEEIDILVISIHLAQETNIINLQNRHNIVDH